MHGMLKALLIIATLAATVLILTAVPTLIEWVTEGKGMMPRIAALIYFGCAISCGLAVYQVIKNNFLQVPGYTFFGLCVPATAFQVGSIKMAFPWIMEFPLSLKHDLTPNNPDFVRVEVLIWLAFFGISMLTYATIRTMRPWEKNDDQHMTLR